MYKPVVLGLVGLLWLAGCQKAAEQGSYGYAAGARADLRSGEATGNAGAQRRFIAVAHKLLIETPEDTLPKAWEAAMELCRTARCEILSSSISNKTHDSPPSAALSLRVAPEDLPKLFELVGKAGSVLQHVTESEDKTGTVIDVEAKLRNMTAFRDRLRSMLGTRSANLKDIIEVERELSKVQAQLDSLTTQRKALANETEKVAVQIDFRARQSIAGTGVSAPLARAWRNAAFVLAESAATLLTFVIAVIPWLLLIVPLFWISGKLVRRLFRRNP
jgi:hypothetical protein